MLDRARPPERARGRGGSAQHQRPDRKLQRLLRRLRLHAAAATPPPAGPIWLGYYRSENGGASFQSSLVPGYPGDTSPYAALAQDPHGELRRSGHRVGRPRPGLHGLGELGRPGRDARRPSATSGSRVFDNPGGDPAAPPSTTASASCGSDDRGKGSSAPNLLGKFHDKTSIEADRTGGPCDGNVYFAWSRFTGNGGEQRSTSSRSTDHGATLVEPEEA